MTEQENEDIFLYGHRLPAADPAWCSQCRKPIIHGQQNVVRINKAPIKVVSPDGRDLGVEGKVEAKAFFHTECFQEVMAHRKIPGRIECKYCGTLSMAKTLPDGRSIKDVCLCSCHGGSDYCSLIVS